MMTTGKVKMILQTDEGFVVLHDSDFAEGGTRDEAMMNLTRKIAVAHKSFRRSRNMKLKAFRHKKLYHSIGLN